MMNIFKTFEIFNRQSISILKDRVVKIFLFETNNPQSKDFCVYSHLKNNNETQISVFNNQGVYNLLNCALERSKQNSRI